VPPSGLAAGRSVETIGDTLKRGDGATLRRVRLEALAGERGEIAVRARHSSGIGGCGR
jgi:hypothetical protein